MCCDAGIINIAQHPRWAWIIALGVQYSGFPQRRAFLKVIRTACESTPDGKPLYWIYGFLLSQTIH